MKNFFFSFNKKNYIFYRKQLLKQTRNDSETSSNTLL